MVKRLTWWPRLIGWEITAIFFFLAYIVTMGKYDKTNWLLKWFFKLVGEAFEEPIKDALEKLAKENDGSNG